MYVLTSFVAASATGCFSNNGLDTPENIQVASQSDVSVFEADSGSDTCFEYNGHVLCGSNVTLNVGPSGGSAKPSDWGVCTFLKSEISALSNYAMLKIDVGADGYYHLIAAVEHTQNNSYVAGIVACRKMSEFIGVPGAESANGTRRFSVNSLDPVPAGSPTTWPSEMLSKTGGLPEDALCVWHGFTGCLTNVPGNDDTSFDTVSGLRYDATPGHGYLLEARATHQNLPIPFQDNGDLTSYASCDSWVKPHQWKYELEKSTWSDGVKGYYAFTGLDAVTYQGGQLLNVDPAKGDCSLQGLLQHGQAGRAATFTKLPNINIWSVGGLAGATFANPQCVFLDQN